MEIFKKNILSDEASLSRFVIRCDSSVIKRCWLVISQSEMLHSLLVRLSKGRCHANICPPSNIIQLVYLGTCKLIVDINLLITYTYHRYSRASLRT